MSALHDTGWAKLNLTLEVLGRRPDGYHEIKSLVAFAAFGDDLWLEPDGDLALRIEGPFGAAIGGENLILKAANVAAGSVPGLKLGRFRLRKVLPVAAGLGGGSADAAAALRLIARVNSAAVTPSLLSEFAPKLGSDVSVCLKSEPAVMMGRGEKIATVQGFPSCGVLLANPRRPLATEAVYAALHAAKLETPPHFKAKRLDFADNLERLLAYVLPRSNALEAPAISLVPEIEEVLKAVRALPGALLTRLSGSGPTCFALFATEDEAKEAAVRLSRQNEKWWIVASVLGAKGGAA
ncbi:MAG TPA: 4-(cytidine 5'-diphospho)-2-C-methyl-D-erythritol kinase [Methyloceanibacter sp.]|nr:4-(cytidine 5'-diphospho)-2-C-methyl-D-erythritol kinase [Methyloceanibacter sp.]